MYSELTNDISYDIIDLIEETMKEWIEIDEYSILFESTSDPVVNAQMKNEEIADRSTNIVVRAIKGVIRMITSFIESITNFFAELTMSGDERAVFNNLREQIKNNPALKNKKFTVKDFRKIGKDYDTILSNIDKELVKAKADDKYGLDKIISDAKDFLGKTLTTSSVIVTSDVAIKMAESDQNIAKGINLILKNDKKTMSELEKSLGKKETKNFKKRINSAAKFSTLTQLKIKILRRKYDTLEDCVKSTISDLSKGGFMNPFTRMGKLFRSNEDTKQVVKAAEKASIAAGKGAIKGTVQAVMDNSPVGKYKQKKVEEANKKKKESIEHTKNFITSRSNKSK